MKYEYCQCCKHSYDTGRKHIYTKEHAKKLSEWYNRQLERVNEVYQIAEELSTLVTSVTHSFWCAFCKKEIKDSGGFLVYWIFIDVNLDQLCFFVSSKNAFDHLGSKDHISRVYAFMKKNGSNYNQYKPESFIMDNDRYQKYMLDCETIKENEEGKNISTSFGPQKPTDIELRAYEMDQMIQEEEKRQEALQRYNQKLYAIYPYQNIKSIYPLYTEQTLLTMPYPCNSFIDASVVLETVSHLLYAVHSNASGFNEKGERVWGGGIVSVPMRKWVLWPIDLLYIYSDQKNNEFIQKRKEETEQKTTPSLSTLHSVPESKNNQYIEIKAPGLSVVSYEMNEPSPYGTIYTNPQSNTLPWLVSKSTAIQQSKRENILNDPIDPRFPKKLRAIDLGIVRTKDRSLSTISKSWLPNYGSAWQVGSRSRYKQEFTKEYRDAKEEEKRYSPSTKESNSIQEYRNQILQRQSSKSELHYSLVWFETKQ